MERSKNGTMTTVCPTDLGLGQAQKVNQFENSATKLQSCLGVKVEYLSSKNIASVKNLQQKYSFELD